MAKNNIDSQVLNSLSLCKSIARDNLNYYEVVFESICDGAERDMIGRAMAQKQDFIEAVDVVLSTCEADRDGTRQTVAANDSCAVKNGEVSEDLRQLEHEERFKNALAACLKQTSENDTLSEMLSHHLEAAEIALTAIKSTSLKL